MLFQKDIPIDVACHRYALNMQVSSGTKNNSSPNEPSCTTVTVSLSGVLLVVTGTPGALHIKVRRESDCKLNRDSSGNITQDHCYGVHNACSLLQRCNSEATCAVTSTHITIILESLSKPGDDTLDDSKFFEYFQLGRALDWFEVLGYRVVEEKVTDYAHLKQALSEQFPVVRNRSELETRFYSSSQKHNQKPSDFVYDLLKIHKILKLEMTEEKLIDHIISRLEPQILDYVEVRHPQTTSNLLQIIDKYEERFLNRKIRGSSWESRDIKPNKNNRFSNRNRQENWRETRGNNIYADNSRPRREFNRFESQGVGDYRRFDGLR
ncbi:uncharacterized protein TNCV_3843141 [Trichonephila clavipes]|nr:uncharacterized protein TNCV_3843141 [Trichonephila clavipes]